jgi:hypothetical protein
MTFQPTLARLQICAPSRTGSPHRLNASVWRWTVTTFLGPLLLASLAAAAEDLPAGATRFPGTSWARCQGEHDYEILYREPPLSSDGNHQLLLHNRETDRTDSLLTFDRHAEALWSPDCRAFAVTDWYASNASRVLLFTLASPNREANLQNLISKAYGSLPEISGNGHVYFHAVAWPKNNVVRVKVSGYGDADPKRFEAFFDCEVGGAVKRVPPK